MTICSVFLFVSKNSLKIFDISMDKFIVWLELHQNKFYLWLIQMKEITIFIYLQKIQCFSACFYRQ